MFFLTDQHRKARNILFITPDFMIRNLMQKTVRHQAVEILTRVSQSDAFAGDLLDSCLEKQNLSRTADGRLLTHLVYGVLRMQGHLDWILARLYRGISSNSATGCRPLRSWMKRSKLPGASSRRRAGWSTPSCEVICAAPAPGLSPTRTKIRRNISPLFIPTPCGWSKNG